MLTIHKPNQLCLMVTCWIGGIGTCLLFVQYFSVSCSHYFPPSYKQEIGKNHANFTIGANPSNKENEDFKPKTQEDKPILLLWYTPYNYIWNYSDCKTVYNIDDCYITDDKSLYNQSDAVLVFQRYVHRDLKNLPPEPRPPFQKWIWFHVESPSNSGRIPGLENRFNLTLSYRRNADISVRYWLTVSKTPYEKFVVPKKDKFVCWIVSNLRPRNRARINYYNELKKYVNVTVFGLINRTRLDPDNYYATMSSCKFYLSFENTINKDYITEKINGPLSSGTVPVVLGTSRRNYEEFYPSNSFIHVNDFPNAKALAEYLLHLDEDDEAYRRYFDWRKHVKATPHLVHRNEEFVIYTCHACQYIARHREYKVAHDIYKWYYDAK